MGWWNQADPRGPLASQGILHGECQANERSCLKNKWMATEEQYRGCPLVLRGTGTQVRVFPHPHSHPCAHMCTHTCKKNIPVVFWVTEVFKMGLWDPYIWTSPTPKQNFRFESAPRGFPILVATFIFTTRGRHQQKLIMEKGLRQLLGSSQEADLKAHFRVQLRETSSREHSYNISQ